MLEDILHPLIEHSNTLPDVQSKYLFVQDHFSRHEDPLFSDIAEAKLLCDMEKQTRYLFAYPLVGNYVLSRIKKESSTPLQSQLLNLIRRTRFVNEHWERYWKDAEYSTDNDAFTVAALNEREQAAHLRQKLKDMVDEAYSITRHWEPWTWRTDPGHSIVAPFGGFYSLFGMYESMVSVSRFGVPPMTIMVLDDEQAEHWYKRLLAVGFAGGGAFSTPTQALEALGRERYDIILSDIELGEGVMNGIAFAKQAYRQQKRRGIRPRIALFSYNKDLLKQAGRLYPGLLFEEPIAKNSFQAYDLLHTAICNSDFYVKRMRREKK